MGNAAYLLLASILTSPAAGVDYHAVAKTFSRAAARAGAARVVVLPLTPRGGLQAHTGKVIADRLSDGLARDRRVRTVGRYALSDLLSETDIARSGLDHPLDAARIGRFLAADAVVTGSYARTTGETVIRINLIDIKSGKVLAALVDHNGAGELGFSRTAPWPAAARRSRTHAPPIDVLALPGLRPGSRKPAAASELRDAPRGSDCPQARAQGEKLLGPVIELKARHWASEIKRRGLDYERIKTRLTRKIFDPDLRRRFRGALKRSFRGGAPPLRTGELKRLSAAESDAFLLRLECSGNRGDH